MAAVAGGGRSTTDGRVTGRCWQTLPRRLAPAVIVATLVPLCECTAPAHGACGDSGRRLHHPRRRRRSRRGRVAAASASAPRAPRRVRLRPPPLPRMPRLGASAEGHPRLLSPPPSLSLPPRPPRDAPLVGGREALPPGDAAAGCRTVPSAASRRRWLRDGSPVGGCHHRRRCRCCCCSSPASRCPSHGGGRNTRRGRPSSPVSLRLLPHGVARCLLRASTIAPQGGADRLRHTGESLLSFPAGAPGRTPAHCCGGLRAARPPAGWQDGSRIRGRTQNTACARFSLRKQRAD